MKKTIGKIGKIMGKATTNTILVQPIRILIIINSIFLPLLLGILVFIILKYAQDIKGIIDKAQKIEGMVEDNIKLGIDIVKENYTNFNDNFNNNFTEDNAKTFISETLIEPLILYINPKIAGVKQLEEIKFDNVKLDEFTTLLDISGHSVNNIIKSNTTNLLKIGCTQEQINKVLSENRSIAYILTHNKLNK